MAESLPKSSSEKNSSLSLKSNTEAGNSDNKTKEGVKTQKQDSSTATEAGRRLDQKCVTKSQRRVCRFFAADRACFFGDECRFLHVKEAISPAELISKSVRKLEITQSSQPKLKEKVVPQRAFLSRDQLGSEAQKKVRTAELNYFKRRFHGCKITESDGCSCVTFSYQVTDPEWTFDLKSIPFSIIIKPNHPLETAVVTLSSESFPDVLKNYINRSLNDFLEERFADCDKNNAFDCVGRALIRWIDKKIFSLFVTGLRKTKLVLEAEQSGLSLIVPSSLPCSSVPVDVNVDLKLDNSIVSSRVASEDKGLKISLRDQVVRGFF
ncbi:hypothetical protein AB6A40_008795 [Gnathostoma spinigerum]|uniref:C3H1-type domain-containing protein n=1 Tax=Gnathostoma spinigerum TaxID=75299 RepID=A0ABD6EQH2_9BILA